MEKQRDGLTSEKDITTMQDELTKAIRGEKKKDAKKKAKLIQGIVLGVIVLLFAIVITHNIYQRSIGNIPSFLGLYIFRVETYSMEPTIEAGDLIVSTKPTSSSNIQVGTVVTFKNLSGDTVTHRIVAIIYDESGNITGYHTKGDNPVNSVDVEVLTYDRIIAICRFRINL